MSVEEDLRRLLERQLELRAKVSGLEWHMSDLQLWRVHAEAQLNQLVKTDEIAEAVAAAVAEKVKETGVHHLTRVQTAIAVCAVAAAILSPILSRLL